MLYDYIMQSVWYVVAFYMGSMFGLLIAGLCVAGKDN